LSESWWLLLLSWQQQCLSSLASSTEENEGKETREILVTFKILLMKVTHHETYNSQIYPILKAVTKNQRYAGICTTHQFF
jgi:hypothetical protein